MALYKTSQSKFMSLAYPSRRGECQKTESD